MSPRDALEGFLPAILEDYESDAPRLIYADYLDESTLESDQARAEFIRIQCALAHLASHEPEATELANQQNELLLKYHSEWTKPISSWVAGCEFRRGILDSISIDASVFAIIGDELFSHLPIRRVRLFNVMEHIHRLARCSHFQQIIELDLCGNELGSVGVMDLINRVDLRHIEVLDLSFNGLNSPALEMLATSGKLPRLRQLSINDNALITDVGLLALARSALGDQLEGLDCSGNQIQGARLHLIPTENGLPRLRRFRIDGNPIGVIGAFGLLDSPMAASLIDRHGRLSLRQSALEGNDFRYLIPPDIQNQIQILDLSNNPLNDDGVIHLVNRWHLPRCRRLHLAHARIGDDGAMTLARSSLMQQLDYLSLASNRRTARSADMLWERRGRWNTVIDISDNPIPSSYLSPIRSASSS